MSRPPRPHFDVVTADPTVRDGRLDYLPLEYGQLLELAESLAGEELGHVVSTGEGNITRTLLELSSLVGHVLAVYQDRYAGEAFLRTANARSSLVRHARRLSYTPDVGLSATGYVALMLKEGLSGAVEAGLELGSSRLGDIAPQTYETLDALTADAALNEMFPADATTPVILAQGTTRITVEGVGHGLASGDVLCLVGAPTWQSLVVDAAEEDRTARTTTLTLRSPLSALIDFSPPSEGGNAEPDPSDPDDVVRFLAHPSVRAASFGWNADPVMYPQERLRNATGSQPTPRPAYWYEVALQVGSTTRSFNARHHYLSRVVDEPLLGTYAVHQSSTALTVHQVTAQMRGSVTLHREVLEAYPTFTVVVTQNPNGSYTTTTVPVTPTPTQVLRTHLSGTVSVLETVDRAGTGQNGSSLTWPGTWLSGWRTEMKVVTREPNPDELGDFLDLPGLLSVLAPGRLVIFSDLAGSRTQVVQLTRVQLMEDEGRTRIWWQALEPAPEEPFQLDDLKVLGNVVQAIHGRTTEEILGDSDGVTPFQRFALDKAPVSMRPAAEGAVPEVELRVDDVAWQRVPDFFDSGPEDRHYRLEIDEEQVASVVFGDGVKGAIPSAGKRNISAVYKVGLGVLGNVGPLRVTRLKSPHPLLDRAFNPGSISGGTGMAEPESVRSQATRYIRTFDRAVSVSDHADLALLYPGVSRTAARWDAASGAILLVAATADGGAPPADLRKFLDARRDDQVRLSIVAPTPRDIVLSLRVSVDTAFLFENVRVGIREVLLGEGEQPGLFTFAGRALGQPAYLSEVQAAVKRVPGVLEARVVTFASVGGDEVFDVVQAQVSEWLRLAPQELTIQKAEDSA
ncbi:hypothetical protein ACLESO_31845 [Pyxidicoccus sp. 3LG]